MDGMICIMENFTIHLAPLPRFFPHPLPVGSIGYVPHKRGWVGHTFQSFNYSFILRGEGEYRTPQGTWPVRAPCVITQWPEAHLEYGPWDEWEELFLIYGVEPLSALRERGFLRRDRRIWSIHDPGPTRRLLADLRTCLSEEERPLSADRVDRICESLLLESLLAAAHTPADANEQALYAIRGHVHEHFTETLDFDEIALEHGFSPSHFRRLWGARFRVPPARYAMQLRIRQARRMLVETDRSVGEIARTLGFADPLYFSRKFRDEVGQTATEYRASHEAPLSLPEAE